MSYRAAAREIGISHGYLHGLVHGTRCPSRRVAEALIEGLPLGWEDAQALLDRAVADGSRRRSQQIELRKLGSW